MHTARAINGIYPWSYPDALAVAVTAGFQRIVGHNDEAGRVYRVYNGHGTAFANEYSHFRFTPFIGATGSATAIALGYYVSTSTPAIMFCTVLVIPSPLSRKVPRHNAVGQRQVAIAPAAHPLNDAPALRGVVFAKRHARGVVTRGSGWRVNPPPS